MNKELTGGELVEYIVNGSPRLAMVAYEDDRCSDEYVTYFISLPSGEILYSVNTAQMSVDILEKSLGIKVVDISKEVVLGE